MAKKKKWSKMTDEEREAYAGQDEVKLNWREVLDGFHKLSEHGEDGCSEHSSLADMITSDTYIPEGLLEEVLDPVEAICLRMFHLEGITMEGIAKSITVSHMIGGKCVYCKQLTWQSVRWKLDSAREKLRKHICDKPHITLLI